MPQLTSAELTKEGKVLTKGAGGFQELFNQPVGASTVGVNKQGGVMLGGAVSPTGQQFQQSFAPGRFDPNDVAPELQPVSPIQAKVDAAKATVAQPKTAAELIGSIGSAEDIGRVGQQLRDLGLLTPEAQAQLRGATSLFGQPTTEQQKQVALQNQDALEKARLDAIQRANQRAQQNVVAPVASQYAQSPEGVTQSGQAGVLAAAQRYAGEVAGSDPEVQKMNALLAQNTQQIDALASAAKDRGMNDFANALLKQKADFEQITKDQIKQREQLAAEARKTADERLSSVLTEDTLAAIADNPAMAESLINSFEGTSFTQAQILGIAQLQKRARELAAKKAPTEEELLKLEQLRTSIASEKAKMAQIGKTPEINKIDYVNGQVALWQQAGLSPEEIIKMRSELLLNMGIKSQDDPLYQAELKKSNAEAQIKDIEALYAGKEPPYGTKDYWDVQRLKAEIGKSEAETAELTGQPITTGAGRGGTLADRNNNPGNLRSAPGASPGEKGFVKFDTPEEGFQAMINDLTAKVTGKSRYSAKIHTLRDLIGVYAPVGDNNDPNSYANVVAKALGISATTPVSQLVSMVPQLAAAMAKHEGFSSPITVKADGSWEIAKAAPQDGLYNKFYQTALSEGLTGSKARKFAETRLEESYKPPTEAQGKAINALIAAQAENDTYKNLTKGLDQVEFAKAINYISKKVTDPESPIQGELVNRASDDPIVRQALLSELRWVNSVLRWESGAAISAGEYLSKGAGFFPRAGDDAATIAAKAAARERQVQGLRSQVGSAGERKLLELEKPIQLKNKIDNYLDNVNAKVNDPNQTYLDSLLQPTQ